MRAVMAVRVVQQRVHAPGVVLGLRRDDRRELRVRGRRRALRVRSDERRRREDVADGVAHDARARVRGRRCRVAGVRGEVVQVRGVGRGEAGLLLLVLAGEDDVYLEFLVQIVLGVRLEHLRRGGQRAHAGRASEDGAPCDGPSLRA